MKNPLKSLVLVSMLAVSLVGAGCAQLGAAAAAGKAAAKSVVKSVAEGQCKKPDLLRASEQRFIFEETAIVIEVHCPPQDAVVDSRYDAAVKDMHSRQAVQDCLTAANSALCVMQWANATGRVESNPDGSQSVDLGELGVMRWYPAGSGGQGRLQQEQSDE